MKIKEKLRRVLLKGTFLIVSDIIVQLLEINYLG